MSVLQNDMKGLIYDYSSITTIHGMKQLILVTKLRKFLWAVLLVASTVLLCYQVNQKFQTLIKNPVSTAINIEYPEYLIFPTVAICNTNGFRLSNVKDDLYPMISELYLAGTVNDQMNFSKYRHIFDSLDGVDSLQYLERVASRIDEMLLSCNNPDNTPCNASNFERISTDFGICYAYNSDTHNPIIVYSAGVRSALYLLLDIEAYERTSGSAGTTGIKVIIYNQTSAPLVRAQGIDLAPGFKTNIGLSRIKRQKIDPSEGGVCTYTANYKYLSNEYYDLDACKVDYMVSNAIQKCGCSPFFGPVQNNGTHICDIEDNFKCVIYYNEPPREAYNCLTNCRTIQFQTALSFSKYPNDFLTQALGQNAMNDLQEKYLNASEIRERYQRDRVDKNTKLVQDMVAVENVLRKFRMEPTVDNYVPTYNRLRENLPCYSDFIDEFEESLLLNPIWDKADHITNDLLRDEKFIHMMHPEISIEDLVANLESYVAKFENETIRARDTLRDSLGALDDLLNIFRESQFEIELASDLTAYVDFMDAVHRFDKRELSKLEWSVKSRDHERMMGELSTSFLHPIQVNLGNIQTIIEEEAANYVASIQLSIQDPELAQLFMEMIFESDDFRSEDCMKEMGDLADQLRAKYMDAKAYPSLLDSPLRIEQLCPVLPPYNATKIVDHTESCIFEHIMPNVTDMLTNVDEVGDFVAGPFDRIIMELSSYSWNHLHTTAFFDENILGLNIYYQDLTLETFVQDRTYDFWSFACDVGGTLGLCLGASLVTIFEMVDFFMLRPLCDVMQGDMEEKKIRKRSETIRRSLNGFKPQQNGAEKY